MGSILKSKLFWVFAALLLLFGLYVVLGFYAAPGMVRSQAVDFVRRYDWTDHTGLAARSDRDRLLELARRYGSRATQALITDALAVGAS